MARIVLLGPTGHTGRLIAERLSGTDTILATYEGGAALAVAPSAGSRQNAAMAKETRKNLLNISGGS